MSHDPYRPPSPARPGPSAPPPPTDPANRARPALRVVLPGGLTCRTWDDFLAVSAQRWDELRDHLVTGQLGAALARAGHADRVPDPNAPDSPDERLDDWLGSLPITRASAPELEVQPSRIELESADAPFKARLRIANVGYRLLRFRVAIEPADVDWLVLPTTAAGLEMVAVEELTLDLSVLPAGRNRRRRARTATLRIESNGGERLVPVLIRPAAGSSVVVDDRLGSRWLGVVVGGSLGALSWPLVRGLGRLSPGGSSWPTAGLVFGVLGLAVGAWVVGRKVGWIDRLFGSLAGGIGGVLASGAAIMAAEALPTAPWWVSVAAWSGLGALAAFATGLTVPRAGAGGGSR